MLLSSDGSAYQVYLADGETALVYYDVGTPNLAIEAVHPRRLFQTLDFHRHCVGGAD